METTTGKPDALALSTARLISSEAKTSPPPEFILTTIVFTVGSSWAISKSSTIL